MKPTIESTILIGWIVQLCAQEDDIDLLDLIYKLLQKSAEEV